MVLLYSLQIIIGSFLIAQANSALYRFVPEYGEVYDDCNHKPEMGGYSDFADVSETVVIADDEGIHFNGTVTIVWDVKETDRVTVNIKPFQTASYNCNIFSHFHYCFCTVVKANEKFYFISTPKTGLEHISH